MRNLPKLGSGKNCNSYYNCHLFSECRRLSGKSPQVNCIIFGYGKNVQESHHKFKHISVSNDLCNCAAGLEATEALQVSFLTLSVLIN